MMVIVQMVDLQVDRCWKDCQTLVCRHRVVRDCDLQVDRCWNDCQISVCCHRVVRDCVGWYKIVGDYFGLIHLDVREIVAVGASLLLRCEVSECVFYTHQLS